MQIPPSRSQEEDAAEECSHGRLRSLSRSWSEHNGLSLLGTPDCRPSSRKSFPSFTMEDLVLGAELRTEHKKGNSLQLGKRLKEMPNPHSSRTKRWLPEDLEQTQVAVKKKIRHFLQDLRTSRSHCTGYEAEVLDGVKDCALEFLTSSGSVLKVRCKDLLRDLQTLEKKVQKSNMAKDFVVKLMLMLSKYTRVQEYLSNVSDHMEIVMQELKDMVTKKNDSRPISAPSGEMKKSRNLLKLASSDSLSPLRGDSKPHLPKVVVSREKEPAAKVQIPKLALSQVKKKEENTRSSIHQNTKLNIINLEKNPAFVGISESRARSFSVDHGAMSTHQKLKDTPKSHSDSTLPELPKLTKSKSLSHLLGAEEEPNATEPENTILCRICEEEIPAGLLKEHSRFCVIANQWDMVALSDDEQLQRLVGVIQSRVEEATILGNANNLQLLQALKTIGQSAYEQADCMECLKLLVKLRVYQEKPEYEEFGAALEALLKNKISALRHVEMAIDESPRLYRMESPRILRSPRPDSPDSPITRSPEPKGMPKITDFKIVKAVAEGGFGRVYLARKKRTKDLYAIKVLKKADMIQKNQVKYVKAERNILARLQNPFVIKMYFSFQSKEYLYIVMEWASGGDCFSLLQKFGALPEEVAKMYIAETVLSLEYLHSIGIVHRDLKPDNLLVDSRGHIKLTDFGLSSIGLADTMSFESRRINLPPYSTPDSPAETHHNNSVPPNTHKHQPPTKAEIREKRKKLYSGVGTPDYLAPEILLGIGHSYPVDWWALGVLLFEFLVGLPPFAADTVDVIFENVHKRQINWPSDLDENAKDLINKLLDLDPEHRLGCNGAEEIKRHPYFSDINFETIYKQTPMFIPKLKDPESTSYFKPREDRFPINDSDLLKVTESLFDSNVQDDLTFGGFWYVNFSNLSAKNMDILDDLPKSRGRSSSF